MSEIVKIISRKADGKISKSWNATLLENENSRLTLLGVFDEEIIHSYLGVIRPGTLSYEYYWLDSWFNIFRFHEPDGSFRNFYCNINTPPEFSKNVLDYVDLEIDVIVRENLKYTILDLDEFEQNSKLYDYSDDIKNKIKEALGELISMIETKKFPFDFEIKN